MVWQLSWGHNNQPQEMGGHNKHKSDQGVYYIISNTTMNKVKQPKLCHHQ